ncbi:hypothetical protein D0T53_03230 [Dysgonomonas sp. 216]|uniref:AAA domain-containing protein n=1 Tax=Dysgonomonas sp. 216 TaxID=2302934 RepID=UPI0013D39EF6|nr:AAA domain-containing protein [Dysgonomonas sp. 216]NDW17929.1 hypothetical protein [Dysgonomonas sp. 216]
MFASETNQQKYEEFVADIQSVDKQNITFREKYIALKRILERSCKDITQNEVLQFPSLFSRLVFIAQKYGLSGKLEWQLQNIRVKASFLLKDDNNIISGTKYEQAKSIVICFVSVVYIGNRVGESLLGDYPKPTSDFNLPDKIRVQLIAIDKEKELLYCYTNIAEGNEIIVKYNVRNVNDSFNPTIDRLWINVQLNLVNSSIDLQTNYVIPRYIVLEPDYLVDASSLAECFQNYGKSYLHYFRKRFEPVAASKHILLGNLANFFLDELVYSDSPELLKFNDLFLKAFRMSPFEYTSCNDIKEKSDFVEFMLKAQAQFDNIKRVVVHDFPANEIDTKQCTLEPAFFCEKFGFQGRLDLLQLSDEENNPSKIIELKSGKIPFPFNDPTKIAINHEVQTVIYRLIIQSVFSKTSRKIFSSILYSSADQCGQNIRMSASYKTLEKEIVNIRNLIIATEHDLYIGNTEVVEHLFTEMFDPDNYSRIPSFFADKLTGLKKILENISDTEQRYFYRFVSFLTRELYLQKIGDEAYESANGVSSLWNKEFEERKEAFDLIAGLEIEDIDDSGNDMKILFNRISDSEFVNFREGEICILYPRENENDTVLTNQILKGTVVWITAKQVLVRFRYKQKNKKYLTSYKYWVLEHDNLDHTYINMFKSLFSFLCVSPEKRELILGATAPETNYEEIPHNANLSKEEKQSCIIDKALAAKDYFLIVGPPGTGKTSIYARRLIEEIYTNPQNNILVLAYTNRAVDELCEAIENALNSENEDIIKYIRIGTELSCGEPYRHRLLQNISANTKSRDELRKVIQNQRIFVGTLAAISNKPELFELKKFNVAIIDEASQILEPQIIGLLPMFDKYIMIGDHKQLSTITLQSEDKSQVIDEKLNQLELFDCRESYFERIFRICQNKGWDNAYAILTYQGRMHTELASYPNTYFYDNMLLPASLWQNEPLELSCLNESDRAHNLVAKYRKAFIPCTDVSTNVISDKVNETEADVVVRIAKAVIDVYKTNGLDFNPRKTLGIITPYRNQIALIKHKLEEVRISELQNIMVDTVERYQGSQRDIIIMSFCINKPYQLDFFCNWNRERNVDRKLNVALTRARQQLFLVGNNYILSQNNLYRQLIEDTTVYSI